MLFDQNQTEFPTEKHKNIWKRAMYYLPEELTLSDKVKSSMDDELFESCKQMRNFLLHSLHDMYENAEIYNFEPYAFLHHSLVEIVDRSENEVNNNLILNTSGWSKRILLKFNEMFNLYANLFANTGIQIKENSDSMIEITNILYPKMFRAMKELRNRNDQYGRGIFYQCDFRKLCPAYKYEKAESKRPEIEDVINDIITDRDMKKLALDFAEHMRKNKMTLRDARFTNAFKAVYKGKCICYVRLKKNSDCIEKFWIITPYLEHIGEYEKSIIGEGLQSFIWDNVHYCRFCRTPCHGHLPGMDITLLGKEIKSVCRGRQPIWVFDPDETAVNCIKRLLEFEQKSREK